MPNRRKGDMTDLKIHRSHVAARLQKMKRDLRHPRLLDMLHAGNWDQMAKDQARASGDANTIDQCERIHDALLSRYVFIRALEAKQEVSP